MVRSQSRRYTCWELARFCLSPPVRDAGARCTLLHGPPGTGKTHVALVEGLRPKQPVYSVTLTEETPAVELRGYFTSVEGRKGGAVFRWTPGPVQRAWESGGRLVVNEVSRGSADVQSLLLAALDDPEHASIILPWGEVLRPKGDFHVVATMNDDPELLSEALRDRFSALISVNAPHPDALARLPQDLRHAARASSEIDDPERRIGFRSWLAFANLRRASGGDELLAAFSAFGARAHDVLNDLALSRAD